MKSCRRPATEAVGTGDGWHQIQAIVGIYSSARRPLWLVGMRFDGAVDVAERAAVWSHECSWTDLAVTEPVCDQAQQQLLMTSGWSRRWTVTTRFADGDVAVPARDLSALPTAGREPVRLFSWRRAQRHRPGLEFLVSTGRQHGYESLADAKLLLMLGFAAELTEVLSQPLRLRFLTAEGPREHVPDFFAQTRSGRWLIDVRPAGRIEPRDEVAFAATAEIAAMTGWGYRVVTGWQRFVAGTVDEFSAQRRPLTDRLGMADMLLDAVAGGPRRFGDLAGQTCAPAIARAYLLHLLWYRRLRLDLRSPLNDHTVIVAGSPGEK